MTDQETTKFSQDATPTAALTANEGDKAVTAPLPAPSSDTNIDANTPADTQAMGESLLAAIEAIVPTETTTPTEAIANVDTITPAETDATTDTNGNPQSVASNAPEKPTSNELPPETKAAAPQVTPGTPNNALESTDDTPIIDATEAAASQPEATPPVEEKPRISFAVLNLDPRLQKGIDEQGFSHCTPIQSEALPHTLQGCDVIGKAQTGTGKTAAFLITIIQNLLMHPEQEERYNGEPRALILAPTRELALQIEKDAKPLLKNTPLNMVSIVGGMDYKKQQKRLQEEIIDIVVGTPGRLIDFVRGKDLFLSETEIVVIDEADRMLDMGFIPDVKRLVRETPYKTYRQTLLFSATFTPDIMNLSENWTTNPVSIEIQPESVANASVDQKIYIVTTEQKINVLYNLITQQNLDRVIVFVNRRDETRDLTTKLKALGLRVAMLSGEIPQHKRLRTLENFRNGRLRVMVATDVAGRGIHIEGISHVVNYTLPEDPEDYVHRIGRTGRAGATGTSVSFACEEDAFLIPAIETLLGDKVLCTHPEPELLAELPELITE